MEGPNTKQKTKMVKPQTGQTGHAYRDEEVARLDLRGFGSEVLPTQPLNPFTFDLF